MKTVFETVNHTEKIILLDMLNFILNIILKINYVRLTVFE